MYLSPLSMSQSFIWNSLHYGWTASTLARKQYSISAIVTAEWNVQPGGSLVVESQTESGAVTTVRLGGGNINTTYRVSCKITTNATPPDELIWAFDVCVIDKQGDGQ